MSKAPQNVGNHTRLVPEFMVGLALLLVNVIWALVMVGRAPALGTVVQLGAAAAMFMAGLSLRRQLLTVQDRVIRLEMRLRLREVLPHDLQAQIPALTVGQLVALRFASDGQLPSLVREVLAGTLTSGKAIKHQVQDWQADYLRA